MRLEGIFLDGEGRVGREGVEVLAGEERPRLEVARAVRLSRCSQVESS